MSEEMEPAQLQLVDVEKAFASKDARLLKRIPGFFIRYLKRIVHQDEINDFLIRNQGVEGLDFVNRVVDYMEIDLEVKNLHKVPRGGRIFFAGNHPLGGLDGLCLIRTIAPSIYPSIRSVSNDLLMNVSPMRNIFIGVNKHGGNSKAYVAEMQEIFESDTPVIFFPSGLVSRRIKGKIEDTEWKSTFIKKAVQYQRDVVPFHFTGRVSGFFYRLANLRKFLGIRFNIEMLYLPDEMIKQKKKRLTLTFGDPIPWQTFLISDSAEKWTLEVRKRVYSLPKNS